MNPIEINMYITDVINKGELYLEIERIRRLLVGLYKYPHADKNIQRHNVRHMEFLFKRLLLAKEAREKVIQNVGDDNRSNA